MTKTFKILLSLFCLITFGKIISSAPLNFNELSSSSEELAKHLKIKLIEHGATIDPIEEIEFYLILIEKANKNPEANKIAQKLYEQLHKHIKLLIRPAIFEQNYSEITDFLEELFTCKRDETTPFKYPLVYAFLAISRLQELQNQNKHMNSEQLAMLRSKIYSNFENAFNKEKSNLKKAYPNITKNKIKALYLIIEKSTFSEKIPFKWNFKKIISTTCWTGTAITLMILILRINSFIDKDLTEIAKSGGAILKDGLPAVQKANKILKKLSPEEDTTPSQETSPIRASTQEASPAPAPSSEANPIQPKKSTSLWDICRSILLDLKVFSGKAARQVKKDEADHRDLVLCRLVDSEGRDIPNQQGAPQYLATDFENLKHVIDRRSRSVTLSATQIETIPSS